MPRCWSARSVAIEVEVIERHAASRASLGVLAYEFSPRTDIPYQPIWLNAVPGKALSTGSPSPRRLTDPGVVGYFGK